MLNACNWVKEHFSAPAVLVASTPEAEDAVLKNGLGSVVDLLRPLGRVSRLDGK
jgi:hypothetical protein